MSRRFEIVIDMDRRCQRCKRPGAVNDTTFCLRCATKVFLAKSRKGGSMPHHFTKNTESVSRFCNTCRRTTMWTVSDGRLGRCVEDHHVEKPPKSKAAAVSAQGSLFDPKDSK